MAKLTVRALTIWMKLEFVGTWRIKMYSHVLHHPNMYQHCKIKIIFIIFDRPIKRKLSDGAVKPATGS